MVHERDSTRREATRMLLLATIFWGLSFPVMKALGMAQQSLLPHTSSWFITANAVTMRFAIAALVLLLICGRTLGQLTRLEVWQGLGLGVFGGVGLMFQMDGLAYTSASTSAFLTTCYCLFLPIIVAIRDRRRPSPMIVACALLVIAGVAILARMDWRTMKMGRGEWETLVGSFLFTAQILWLERPLFSANRVRHFSFVMFAVTALISLPVSLATAHDARDWLTAYSSPAVLGFLAILVVFCTLAANLMMNRWQPRLPAAEAGLIYGAEPVFASFFALFLPAWFSIWTGLNYPNEVLTFHLLAGGGLITAANVLIQLSRPSSPPVSKATAEIAAGEASPG